MHLPTSRTPSRRLRGIAVAALLALGVQGGSVDIAAQAKGATPSKAVMPTHARGTFEVTLKLQAPQEGDEPAVGRMTLDKQFDGDLEGTGKGLMLSAGNPAAGSAGYVAMERIVGTLNGKRGSFVLQHSGTMTPEGGGDLIITVVPSSGTDELAGLSGRFSIEVVDKKHLYDFEYAIK